MKTTARLLTLCLISLSGLAQNVEKLKFKRDKSIIYFFQKDERTDTLTRLSEHFFYLVVPDTLKKDLSIEVENGQLMLTASDSIVKLNHLPGFKYESFYTLKENENPKKSREKKYEFKTMVDGTSYHPQNRIIISLINKRTGGLILENVFIYR